MNIGTVTINSKLALAPMAGVSDQAFRIICRELGCGYTVTEMISAKALCYQDKKTRRIMALAPDEHPAAIQLFGSDVVCMEEAAAKIMELEQPDVIDINMGCPVPKVANSGDGSALMKDPDKAGRIVEAVKRGCGIPVTVKTRKGWDMGHINAVEFCQVLESAGADAVTIHGRTKTQMYAGKADWDIIRAGEGSPLHPSHCQRGHLCAGGCRSYFALHRCRHGYGGSGRLWRPLDLPRAIAAIEGRENPPSSPFGGAVPGCSAAIPAGGGAEGGKDRLSGSPKSTTPGISAGWPTRCSGRRKSLKFLLWRTSTALPRASAESWCELTV